MDRYLTLFPLNERVMVDIEKIRGLASRISRGGYSYSGGGDIHISESKRGTFTTAAKRHGMSVQAFASRVLANKDKYSPSMVKKANFARNAAKWHAAGGIIDRYGSDAVMAAIAKTRDAHRFNMGGPEKSTELRSAYDKYRRLKGVAGYSDGDYPTRIRRNDTKTRDRSEYWTDRAHRNIYEGETGVKIPQSGDPNMGYAIPYVIDKEVKVPGVGRFTTNALDSLAKYAGGVDLSLQAALGLPAHETKMGANPHFNTKKVPKGATAEEKAAIEKYNNELLNGNYIREFGVLPAEYYVRDFEYNRTGHEIPHNVPPLQHAFEYLKAGKYNPADQWHTPGVLSAGAKMLDSPAVREWLKTSPYAKGVRVRSGWNPEKKNYKDL